MRGGFGEDGIHGMGVGEVLDMYGSSFVLVGRYESHGWGYGSREVCIGLCKAHGRGVQDALVFENGWVVYSSCSPTRSIQSHESFIENEGLRTEKPSSNSIMSSRYYSQLTHSSRHQLYNHPSLRSIKQHLSHRSFHAQINSHRMLSLLTIPAAMIISLQI
jgi:hypothetical protein